MTRSEIQKSAQVKYDSPSEKTFFLGCINRKGLFGISENRSRTWYVKFVDTSDENVIEYITDYEHLALYYEKLTGEKIGQCEYCGKLFRQNKNSTALFCYKHRGYKKRLDKQIRAGICIDCGDSFTVLATNTKKCRCDNCQKIKDKENAKLRKQKQREKLTIKY